MKIQKISVENYKPIAEQEINLNGCSAIVTAGNNQGKTSLLAGLIDRLHSEKPDIIVKEGEEKGFQKMELTDGSTLEWHFTQKSERFVYQTKDGVKQTSGIIEAFGERYFGKRFNIDEFLNSGPKKQMQWLQRVADIDLDEINQRYQAAYDNRTEKNRELKRLESQDMAKPEKVEKPDVEKIKAELQSAREANEQLRQDYNAVKMAKNTVEAVAEEVDGTPLQEFFDFQGAEKYIKSITPKELYVDTDVIQERLEQAQEQLRAYDRYEYDLEQYEQWKSELKEAKEAAKQADKAVKAIEQEKQELIANADIPAGFDITDNGLEYNGYPLTENQISKSDKYIAALKLGERVLGEVRTLHFDASMLDKHSLDKVQAWAESKDLQLLIERPDFEGGEIQYELIQK